ncbi:MULTISPECIES: M15 family metallopeptidase [unclassified Paenibacillus]|uniref:M15 family metallopeptidase n=1 Tax=unclassified Paenibacillus TaxID=185978 RepID=UPI00104E3E75|nr:MULTISPECIES: M15 family metallopeptidase [unclassified Paenibacillus]NIK70699.1 peptidoglycan L-alanyl-D-glutamate endopeptidase CwlK [Paenibacillus sp. BK720]TCM93329.1 peptidoglycan L-alanyl-D-glutamate endopeptidase CwlK [Paenibacillus sp. BK033]
MPEPLARQNTTVGRLGQPYVRPEQKQKRSRVMTSLVLIAIIVMGWRWVESVQDHPAPAREQAPAKSTAIVGLHPIVAEKADELVAQTGKLGIKIMITDDFRSSEEQNALYKKGRSEPGQVVTNVRGGASYHNYGLAVDFALVKPDGDVIWDMEYDGNRNGKSDWMEVVSAAKKLGFAWGGDWTSFKDYPHLQMDFGYSIKDLQNGKRPPATE